MTALIFKLQHHVARATLGLMAALVLTSSIAVAQQQQSIEAA